MDSGAWRATDQGIAKCPTPPINEHFTFLKRSPTFLSADSFRVHPGSYLCLLPHLQLTEPPYWTLGLPVRTCIGLDPSLTGCKTHCLMPPWELQIVLWAESPPDYPTTRRVGHRGKLRPKALCSVAFQASVRTARQRSCPQVYCADTILPWSYCVSPHWGNSRNGMAETWSHLFTSLWVRMLEKMMWFKRSLFQPDLNTVTQTT